MPAMTPTTGKAQLQNVEYVGIGLSVKPMPFTQAVNAV
jgi:hypothetical protein